MDFEPTERCTDFSERLNAFMDECVYPAETVFQEQLRRPATRTPIRPVMEELRAEARSAGCGTSSIPTRSTGQG